MNEPPVELQWAIQAIKSFTNVVEYLKKTVLAGWPIETKGLPTETQARMIEAIYHEIMLHSYPGISEHEAWVLAGNCVARLVRDVGI